MIEIKGLQYKYAGSRNLVFDHFSLTLESDKIYGLLGKNGMGKSTLLYLIAGLLRQNHGSITIDGVDSQAHNPETLSEIFLVPEELDLPAMSLESYLRMQMPFYPRFNRDVLMSCLEDFELSHDVKLNALSMGQKKKVYMSVALAANTRYLIMDEPTNGLDIPSKSQFRKVVANNMSDERTMIISTHQVHDVESLLDHILILDHSRMLMNSAVSDICERYSFEFHQLADMPQNVLYSEPSPMGNAVIVPRQEGDDYTPLNLELLFDAVCKGALAIKKE